jgi:RNA polymerase-binding protein DksA
MMIDSKTLKELKKTLIREKEELEKNLGRIARPVDKETGDYETSFDKIGTDKEDNATEVEQYTQNLPVESTLEKKLEDVINALSKIEKGTYGKCENCDAYIPVERLKANPSARTCLKCNE